MTELQELELQNRLNSFSDLYDKKIDGIFDSIDKDISKLYAKYAKDNKMTYNQALEYLTDNERNIFQRDLAFYLEKIRDKEYLKTHSSELQALSVRARVKRLEYIKASVLKNCDVLYGEFYNDSKELLEGEIDNGYKGAIEELRETVKNKKIPPSKIKDLTPIQKRLLEPQPDKLGYWGEISRQRIEEIINYPWSGEDYSTKVWNNKEQLIKQLNSTFTQGFITGRAYSQVVSDMNKVLNTDKHKIDRLVRTEGNYFSNQGFKHAYEKYGVEKYEFIAKIDQRTSPACREHDGHIYRMDEAVVGKNMPPLHPYCRSRIIPVVKW